MYRISRILLKYFTFGVNDEEAQELKRWREESELNESIFQKIGSRGFMEDAMDPVHREELAEQWRLLEKVTLAAGRRKRRIRNIRWAAAVMIPLFFTAVYMYMMPGNEVKEARVESVLSGTTKTVIHLVDGKRVAVVQDTFFQEGMKTVLSKNQLDSVHFLSKANREGVSDRTYRIEVPRGEGYVTRLEDGSIVHLDAESELTIPERFHADRREVELVGHAYFVVAKDSTRPFVVKSGDINVRVLGTEFDLNAYKGKDVATTLVRGVVEVSDPRTSRRLKPNQRAVVDAEGQVTVSDVDVYPYIAWKEKRIVFVNQPLAVIMESLERLYDVSFVFLSDEMRQECFTLDIEKYEEIMPVLRSIEKTDKVYFEIRDKEILVYKK